MIKRTALLFFVGAALAGCETTPLDQLSYSEKKAVAQTMINRCLAQGIKMNSPDMMPCAKSELDRESAVRAVNRAKASNAGQALAGGLGAYGQALQNNAATYNANRPLNCTTTPHSTFVGGTPSSYSTSCY